jgi:hypothetical protein
MLEHFQWLTRSTVYFARFFVKGLRAQIDRDLYRGHMQEAVRGVAGLTILEDSVEDLVLREGQEGGKLGVTGVCLGKEGEGKGRRGEGGRGRAGERESKEEGREGGGGGSLE